MDKIKSTLIILVSSVLMIVVASILQYRSTTQIAWTGTAWFINNNGYMATADHVVKGAKVLVVNYRGKSYNAYVVARDPNNDIAIIKTFILTAHPIPLNSIALGETKIAIIGYPSPAFLGYNLHMSLGTATLGGVFRKTVYTSANTCPGNSGSPIIDQRGVSLGVLTSAYSFYIYNDKTECSSESFGTQSVHLIELANKYHIHVNTNSNFINRSFGYWFAKYNDSILLVYGEDNE